MSANPMRIGWIGTGVMGAAMCGHLLDKGTKQPITDIGIAEALSWLVREFRIGAKHRL